MRGKLGGSKGGLKFKPCLWKCDLARRRLTRYAIANGALACPLQREWAEAVQSVVSAGKNAFYGYEVPRQHVDVGL